MTTNLLAQGLVVLLVLAAVNSQPQVLDFTYTEYQVKQERGQKEQITVSLQRSIFSRYEFPNTWEISQFLAETLQKETPLPQITNFAQEISLIKDLGARFLKLSNKAQLVVRNIRQLPEMKNDLSIVVKEQQLIAIQTHEAKLNALNDQINNKGIQLQKIVQQLMIQQQNPLFKQSALSFEKRALEQKIELLNELKDESRSNEKAIERKFNQNKLNEYFQDLNTIFKSQNGLIDAIDTLLKNHNELTILKARVTSLTSQLKAHDLTLAEKQQCNTEFQKIKQKQRHDRQVLKLIQTLKEKKLQFNQPNKYCQGVEKKLIDRIKKLLIGYDYVYECAQELQHVRGNRDKIKKQLEEAQKKLDDLQLSRGVDEFRKTFQNNRAVITSKVQQLKSLKLDQFYRYPNLIQTEIASTQNRIQQIQNTLQNLPMKSNYDLASIQQNIRLKVGEIESLKAAYCKANDLYNRDSQIVQNKISKLQQQQQYNAWIRNVQIQKLHELESLKTQMKQIETSIMQYLKQLAHKS